MSLGKNLQYLRMLHNNMTQEELANQLQVSRQTVSKWELNQGNPELSKVKEICNLFNCNADQLLFGNIDIQSGAYSEIKIEQLEAIDYVKYVVISSEPEDDAIYKVRQMAQKIGIETPKIIGWDFPHLSPEQINVYHMHGYTAALVIPEDFEVEGMDLPIETVKKQYYVTITIRKPMDDPFHLVSYAYKAVFQYITVNRYTYNDFAFEHQYFEDGIEYMNICVAIQ